MNCYVCDRIILSSKLHRFCENCLNKAAEKIDREGLTEEEIDERAGRILQGRLDKKWEKYHKENREEETLPEVKPEEKTPVVTEANKTKLQDNNTIKKENGGETLKINLSEIAEKIQVRDFQENIVQDIKGNIKTFGYKENFPLLVRRINGKYKLIDGNHRVKALEELGVSEAPVKIIEEDWTPEREEKEAWDCNKASETSAKATFIDHAEYVWKKAEEGLTQEKIGEILGWNVSKIKQYSALKSIDEKAWQEIVTTFQTNKKLHPEECVTDKVTVVTFTEGLLREVLQLTPDQQLELVQDLIAGKRTKGQFKTLAQRYKARNEMKKYALEKLTMVSEDLKEKAKAEIHKGIYDKEWLTNKGQSSGLEKLIVSIIEEWQEKNSIQLIHGDFYEEINNIPNGTINLIITDPPYHVSSERIFNLPGRKDLSKNFGDWDKATSKEKLNYLFSIWANEFKRILKDNGSGYIFHNYRHTSYIIDALESEGFKVNTVIAWHKTNPGCKIMKSSYMDSWEGIIFFTKPDPVFNWSTQNELHNHIETSICMGNERLKDDKGEVLHPTQKPEEIVEWLMENSSFRGDTIFDGFMGVGTVAKVSQKLGRKFIGIEKEKNFFEATQRRISK